VSSRVRTPVYLDHHATTPLDPSVLDLMYRVQRDHFGNPSSSGHAFGWAAAALVETARRQVAGLIGAEPGEIIFTSGATEANNLALLGGARAYRGQGRHLVSTSLEHEAVARPLVALQAEGWEVTLVPGDDQGLVSPEAVARALRPDTVLVSVIAAQNEIGTLQPLADIGELCRQHGAVLHTDAAQAVGKIPLNVRELGVGMMSLSAHKMYGPKGVGALYVSRRDPRVQLEPMLHGGGQERGWRSGTLNVPGIAGLGQAALVAGELLPSEGPHLRALAARLLAAVQKEIPEVILNGHPGHRLPGSLNLGFPGLGGRSLLSKLTTLAVSSGSACSSAEGKPSAILLGLGRDENLAVSSLRISLGRSTTEAEVDYAAATIVAAVRLLSPQ
jgi:cysteine desulfurase